MNTTTTPISLSFRPIASPQYENHIRLLYGTALSTTGKPPAMIWVYTASEITGYTPTPDAYFGQHMIR